MGKLTISMAMFNSYVKLPEGSQPDSFTAPASRCAGTAAHLEGDSENLETCLLEEGVRPSEIHGISPTSGISLIWLVVFSPN